MAIKDQDRRLSSKRPRQQTAPSYVQLYEVAHRVAQLQADSLEPAYPVLGWLCAISIDGASMPRPSLALARRPGCLHDSCHHNAERHQQDQRPNLARSPGKVHQVLLVHRPATIAMQHDVIIMNRHNCGTLRSFGQSLVLPASLQHNNDMIDPRHQVYAHS